MKKIEKSENKLISNNSYLYLIGNLNNIIIGTISVV